MRYPAPEHGRKVRGPVQEIPQEDGPPIRRRLYIRSTRVMSHALAAEFKARGVRKFVEAVAE